VKLIKPFFRKLYYFLIHFSKEFSLKYNIKISNDKLTFRLSKLDISIPYMDSKINKLFLKINLKDGF